MKKLVVYAASAAMAASLAAPAPAMAQNNTKGDARFAVEFCSAFFSGGGRGVNQGGCTSSFRAKDAAAICKGLKDFGNLDFFGFKTQGECVVFFNELFDSF